MIAKSWFSRCWQWHLGGCVAIIGALSGGVSDRVLAQIVPDNTLGAEGSVVTPDVNIRVFKAIALMGVQLAVLTCSTVFRSLMWGKAGGLILLILLELRTF
jgi:hypothetical protein